ncbi:MAG TPA: Mu transposase C-terminal domain-containing protein [Oligoflexus sp.]|uniref:Mu transposase C-terminal domain-containing protein n=1 Tax=Oligoflexus sp. TaxID=1971216 RepID=UPI002D7F258A|nr:Mu transposase C-terminal domain-containing protein [Oligoflexus sp.]HET9239234.1 Mu transposase C-terminal domain-containing protein [Oligoflexus sp.]
MDLSEYPKDLWQEAERRVSVIAELARLPACSQQSVESAASELELSPRQVYELIKRYRSHASTSSLVPGKSSGGRGKPRTKVDQERLVSEVVMEVYCSRQRPSVAAAYREVLRRAKSQGLKPPSSCTLWRRIGKLDPGELAKREPLSKMTKSSRQSSLEASEPLDIVQIDHTPVDLIIVDSQERKPIGRPYLTLAIDVFSRCVPGFYLSLDPPSATSVALCITSIIANKTSWLLEHEIDAEWPLHGKPACIHVDNGSEFHGEAFERGCSQHGIKIHYRPPGRPHYGGIVERVLGTLMKLVHEIPGTTFSNIRERGSYASEKLACLTIKELEKWLLVAITKFYHNAPHRGLGQSPFQKLDEAYKSGFTAKVFDEASVKLDFLPIYRRTLQREGILLDHILYYSNSLASLIPRRLDFGKLIIRRDPRDLGQVYVSDPDGNGYIRVPYRSIYRPPISLYEHRAATKNIRRAKTDVTEEQIFSAIEEMRKIEDEGKRMTSKERRRREKRPATRQNRKQGQENSTKALSPALSHVEPFPDVETWR